MMKQKTLSLLGLWCMLFIQPCLAQRQKDCATVENISFNVVENTLQVFYEIRNPAPNTYYELEAIIIDSSYRKHPVLEGKGDLKGPIAPRGQRHFSVSLNQMKITRGVFQVMFSIKPYVFGGGPSNALLSAALPGLGDFFVFPKSSFGIAIMGAGFLCVAAGISAANSADKHYKQYKAAQFDQALMDEHFEKARSLQKESYNWLAAAALIYIADITLVTWKGLKNKKLKKQYPLLQAEKTLQKPEQGFSLLLQPPPSQAASPLLHLRYNF